MAAEKMRVMSDFRLLTSDFCLLKPNSSMKTFLRLFLSVILTASLAACAGDKGDKDALPPDEPVESLYNKAADLMDHGEYKDAAKQFAEVERQHPYSQWATKAQMMEAFAYYQNLDYDEAITALNQFIELHPGSNDVAYAYYLRALCNYERISDVRRDQTDARDALKGMQEVISRYPDSSYAKDAKLKISLISDHIAGAEMNVGRWYIGQKLYISAIDRFRTVVEKYQTTSHVPEALERLVECYVALGIKKEAQATAAVLGYNFPGSDWYKDAYSLLVQNNMAPEKDDQSWIGRVWNGVF
jgi:outer membrane protein assembly factor BamD